MSTPPFSDIGRLMRLQGMAAQLVEAVREAKNHAELEAVDVQLDTVVAEVAMALGDHLTDEFGRVMAMNDGIRSNVARARAYALLGWLNGAIEAATWERKLQADAAAYAEARLRKERPTGFSASGE